MQNLSRVECFLLLQNEPAVGTCVEMEVTLPLWIAGLATERLHCQARVVEVHKENMNGRTGVLCRLESFHLIPAAADMENAAVGGEESAE